MCTGGSQVLANRCRYANKTGQTDSSPASGTSLAAYVGRCAEERNKELRRAIKTAENHRDSVTDAGESRRGSAVLVRVVQTHQTDKHNCKRRTRGQVKRGFN